MFQLIMNEDRTEMVNSVVVIEEQNSESSFAMEQDDNCNLSYETINSFTMEEDAGVNLSDSIGAISIQNEEPKKNFFDENDLESIQNHLVMALELTKTQENKHRHYEKICSELEKRCANLEKDKIELEKHCENLEKILNESQEECKNKYLEILELKKNLKDILFSCQNLVN